MRNKKSLGIKARVEKSGEEILGFEISGHSGFAQRGEDIVCAAVSMNSIQTVNAIELFTTSQAEIDNRDGYLKCRLQNNSAEAQLLLKSFVMGLEMILQEYGKEYIQIEYKEV